MYLQEWSVFVPISKPKPWLKEKMFDLVVTIVITAVGVYVALISRVIVVEQRALANENAIRDLKEDWVREITFIKNDISEIRNAIIPGN